MVVDGEGVVVAIGTVGGVAAVAPDQLDRRAVDRHQQRPVGALQRRQLGGAATAEHVGQVDADSVDAGLLQQRVEPRRVGALGQPEAAAPLACAGLLQPRALRGDPGLDLQPHARVGRQQRQHRVRRRRGPGGVADEGVQQPAGALQLARPRERALVVAGGPLQLGRPVVVAARPAAVGVEPVSDPADVAQEGGEAVDHARRRELVGEHRRQREGDLLAARVEQLQQRQVAGRERLPQPLLAERPGAVALDVGHVRVEDERQLAAVAGGSHQGRQTATKSSARSSSASSPARSAKSRAEIAGVKRS